MKLEYLWVDGTEPTARLRSKTKIIHSDIDPNNISTVPIWNFDGSSTNQASAKNSDLKLQPVRIFGNPIDGGYLVLCEVFNLDGTPHSTNHRFECRSAQDKCNGMEPMFGIEQEYFIFHGRDTIASEKLGLSPPEGRYFCGVGGNVAFGRKIAQKHLDYCIEAGLSVEGINAEVAPGQWEFQIGILNAVDLSDELWVARLLLDRVAEEEGYWINYTAKPYTNWNGSGAHLNFSTKGMREGTVKCEEVCELIGKRVQQHLDVYGHDYQRRLTGKHETCSYQEFRYGYADRTASIRISVTGKFIEDRRPNANLDPYKATRVMLESVSSLKA